MQEELVTLCVSQDDPNILSCQDLQTIPLGNVFCIGRRSEVQISGDHKAPQLLTLKQIHGTDIIELDENFFNAGNSQELVPADGFWVRTLNVPSVFSALKGRNLSGFGIRTADCVPLFLCTDTAIALIHAGWRGLAAGIIHKFADLLNEHKLGRRLTTAFIGPCAHVECYEVKADTLQMFTDRKVAYCYRDNRLYLDLPSTVKLQLEECFEAECPLSVTGNCTICDEKFWSYRREGAAAGRNYTYYSINDSL